MSQQWHSIDTCPVLGEGRAKGWQKASVPGEQKQEGGRGGRVLTSKVLRFSPKNNGSESSFHLRNTALATNGREREDVGHY